MIPPSRALIARGRESELRRRRRRSEENGLLFRSLRSLLVQPIFHTMRLPYLHDPSGIAHRVRIIVLFFVNHIFICQEIVFTLRAITVLLFYDIFLLLFSGFNSIAERSLAAGFPLLIEYGHFLGFEV